MKASFDDALAECRRLKSDLFSVLNAYENRYLQENIHGKFWIGYRDKGMGYSKILKCMIKPLKTDFYPVGDFDNQFKKYSLNIL